MLYFSNDIFHFIFFFLFINENFIWNLRIEQKGRIISALVLLYSYIPESLQEKYIYLLNVMTHKCWYACKTTKLLNVETKYYWYWTLGNLFNLKSSLLLLSITFICCILFGHFNMKVMSNINAAFDKWYLKNICIITLLYIFEKFQTCCVPAYLFFIFLFKFMSA